MGMPVAPAVPIHQPPLVDDDFTREFRRGIDRVVEAMEGLVHFVLVAERNDFLGQFGD